MATSGSSGRPGSSGEHAIQEQLGSTHRADRFYADQVLDHLNERMREFTGRQEMFFLSTADRDGNCDSTFRAGPPGFLQVLDERTLAFPEYRGNGVHASLGNIRENPHLGILLVDFVRARIGLHVNGSAEILEDAEIRAEHPGLPQDPVPGRRAELWVRVTVDEAYIHCAKHIPHLQYAPKRTSQDWGTDDYKRKGGDFFGTARDRAERESAEAGAPAGPAEPEVPAVPEDGPRPVDAPPTPAPVSADAAGRPGGVPAPAPVPAAETIRPPAPERPPVPAEPPAPAPSAQAWRERAERLLAEARARRAAGERPSYEEWFSPPQ
ncbi:pyridoxamine 5'-phosphate oxidase family protein [Streptomyces sp. GSL17-111]|uniref:pyridoxamine 5'-phosphate oxidase family protein n=1 Tax=Streptomyces sp. GSL17-111 TaxID=3121596 RepID=UPI0030F450F1